LEEMISEQYEQAKRTLWITKIIIQFAISISEIPFPAGKSLIDKIDFINSEIRKQSEFPNYSINQTVEETITEEDFFDINKEIDHQLIENNDIARGMSRNAVIQSWGNPDMEEFAGNPVYGNERWVYNKQVSTDQGYKQERRLIYFEAGRVVGWETE
ncbi:MAG: hypothetical protein AABZ31_15180, partial [Bdellovibrionota bacterium]